jgi:hypothetical protein
LLRPFERAAAIRRAERAAAPHAGRVSILEPTILSVVDSNVGTTFIVVTFVESRQSR